MHTRTGRRVEPGLDRAPVKTGGHGGGNAPWLARSPPSIAEIIGDRGESIGLVGEDVRAPVTITVSGKPQIDAGEELRIAECARPTADQLIARIALVRNLEQVDEFVCEQFSPAPFSCERFQGLRQIERTLDLAISGFVAV